MPEEQTVTVLLDSDEWYPVYFIAKPGSTYASPRSIPVGLEARARAAFEEFEAVQALLKSAYEAPR